MNRAGLLCTLSAAWFSICACCGVSPSGQPVTFGDQSNIIIWNPRTKTEHFVRNAYFQSNAKDFGFIAPTPTVPELETADPGVFDILVSLKPEPPSIEIGCGAGEIPKFSKVEILQEKNVGAYHAVTIKSDDAPAISKYLNANGYATNDEFEMWAEFYAAKHWVLTAFKVRQTKSNIRESGVIRMSFKTEKPFNPYLVPGNNRSNSGTLKIFFVSDGEYRAEIGSKTPWDHKLWDASVPMNSQIEVLNGLKLGASDAIENPTVTYFEKENWLEGAPDDLYFTKMKSIPTGPVGVTLLAIGAFLWYFTKRRRAKFA